LITAREAAATDHEGSRIESLIRARITQLWQTRMLRYTKLTVTDEIENALSYYRSTFLAEIPRLYAQIEEALPGHEIAPFFRMGNWIGGDRDGNPNVTADTLALALRRQCETALRFYLTEVHELGAELSLSTLLVQITPAMAALAEASDVPVVNALTAEHHPCQALADLLTLRERFGDLEGLRVAFVGDGNNVARSLAILGRTAGFVVVVASPQGYVLEDGLCETVSEPGEAAEGAAAVYTDVWASMGDESDAERRNADFEGFQLDEKVMSRARGDAIALHCLPAHPGEEITAEVLYGSQSAVWDQAENRLHTQKALLEYLIDA